MELGKLEEITGKRGKLSKLKSIINKFKKCYMVSNIPFYLCPQQVQDCVLVRIRGVTEVT